MHGHYLRSTVRQLIGEDDTFLWLFRGDLKEGTESEIISAVRTKCHATKILQTKTDSKLRLCQQFDETIDHIIPACPILAKEEHIKKCNVM
jgi:hypothetical protein